MAQISMYDLAMLIWLETGCDGYHTSPICKRDYVHSYSSNINGRSASTRFRSGGK